MQYNIAKDSNIQMGEPILFKNVSSEYDGNFGDCTEKTKISRAWEACPWSNPGKGGEIGNKTTKDIGDTSAYTGGWHPTTSGQKGTFNYTPTSSGSGYVLEVIPNWDKLTWFSAAGPNYSDCQDSVPFDLYTTNNQMCTPYGLIKQWAGYSTNYHTGFPSMISINRPGCAGCSGSGNNNRILGSFDVEMSGDSCPGYNELKQNPDVVAIDYPYLASRKISNAAPSSAGFYGPDKLPTNYYQGLDPNLYPRGKGKCFYPKDIIKDDSDLQKLSTLKDQKQIPEGLFDSLAANYCYSKVNGGCGNDLDGIPIIDCVKFKVDELAPNSADKPCIKWRSGKLTTREGREYLDNLSRQWCNTANNANTPLCDCIKKESINGAKIRDFYKTMTNNHSQLLTTVPPACWFLPCQEKSYALEIYNADKNCASVVNICNQINTAVDESVIANNSQYLNCTASANSYGESNTMQDGSILDSIGSGNNTDTTNKFDFSITNPYIYIPLIIIVFLIVIGIIIAVSSSGGDGNSSKRRSRNQDDNEEDDNEDEDEYRRQPPPYYPPPQSYYPPPPSYYPPPTPYYQNQGFQQR